MFSKTIIAFSLLVITLPLFAKDDMSEGLAIIQKSSEQKDFVESVANLAKAKDVAAISLLIDEKQLSSDGTSDYINKWLNEKIFPFFENYERLHNYQGYSKAVLDDGRVGVWHYKYIVDANGKRHPFRIAVIRVGDEYQVLDIVVNECVKKRHPICE